MHFIGACERAGPRSFHAVTGVRTFESGSGDMKYRGRQNVTNPKSCKAPAAVSSCIRT